MTSVFKEGRKSFCAEQLIRTFEVLVIIVRLFGLGWSIDKRYGGLSLAFQRRQYLFGESLASGARTT